MSIQKAAVEIEFDPTKDGANIAKHGVSLAFGARVFEDADHLVLSAERPADGEQRSKALGMVDGRLWTAIFVHRAHRVRFVSVRKSNEQERRTYHRP